MRKIKNLLILAGGDSTRFWPLTNKNLINFINEPLISYLISQVKQIAQSIFIVANDDNINQIKLILQKIISLNRCFIIPQGNLYPGQAGAIISCQNKIKGEVLILNSNDIFNFDILNLLIKRVNQSSPQFLLTAKKIKEYFPGGYLILKNKKLVGIIEKPPKNKTPSNLVRLMADYFTDFDILIDLIKKIKNKGDDVYEQALNLGIKSLKSDYFIYDDYWYSLKYPWHTLSLMNYFLHLIKETKIGKNSAIKKNSLITGLVYIGNNVKIGNFTKIVGPAFIGDGTIIGDYVMIRESHIGKNCLIGGYSEVVRSYLADGVYLHRNYAGDSVLDRNVFMGAGAVLANLRFDEKSVKSAVSGKKIDTQMNKLGAMIGANTKIGVNTAILPGIKIGKNTFIGPGQMIDIDIGDNKFVFKGKITKNRL